MQGNEKEQTQSSFPAVHCKGGCTALQERMQCTAEAVAVHCVRDGKRDTENVSPIQDKRKGRKDSPLRVHYSLIL